MEINKQALYEGYIWWSDKTNPEILKGQPFAPELTDGINPFVIEGQLWDEENGISLSIRYADGHHVIISHSVTKEDLKSNDNPKPEFYIRHRIEGTGRLRFLRYWKTEADEYCEGFETLRPDKLVFVGFEKSGEEE